MQLVFEIYGFLLRGWLGCLAELAELAGWAEGTKKKEGKGGRRRRKGEEGGRRTRREEGAGRRRNEGGTRKWQFSSCLIAVLLTWSL